MPPVQYKAVVQDARQLTHDVRELTFKIQSPSEWDYKAGQYISFFCPREGNPKPIARMYSLCSNPTEMGVAKVVYNYVGGPGTQFLQALQVGQDVDFKGPYGHFVLKQDSTRDAVFIATGTGVAPFKSMAEEELAKGNKRNFVILWGLRHLKDLYYKDLFADLEKKYPNFKCHITLSQEADWPGLHGRVTAHIKSLFKSVDNMEAYLCGSDAMIQDVTAQLKSIGECPILREKYF